METIESSASSTQDSRKRVSSPDVLPVQTFEFGAEPVPSPSPRLHSLYARTRNGLARKFPRLDRLVQYFNGPRPRRDLEDPIPLFTLTLYTGHRARTVALEPALTRITRPLTAPWLFVLLTAAYIIGFAFFSRAQSFLVPADSFVGCTSTYWLANDQCGFDGSSCLPTSYDTFDFRCPSGCTSTILLNPRTVGNEQMVYEPLLVGGGDINKTYRGDSFICSAAVQAGVISDSKGGCATLQLVANYTNFLPTVANGLASIGFPTIFPLGYQVLETTSLRHCTDYRREALAMNAIVTASLFLLFRPKAIVVFWCLVCIGFWHVSLFSQPRGYPPDLSGAFETFLPCLFISYALWRYAFRFVLPAFMKMPIEGMVWYLLPFWVGVLNNQTFDMLPLDRLVSSDITARPGALTTLIVLIVIVVVIVINQIRVIRKTGWLGHYLFWYVIGGLLVLVLSQLPGLSIRIHHYFIALVLLPGTAFPTRLSAIYQGLLLGLFCNGAAAYGFDSILQTAAELRRDAPLGSALPDFITNATTYNASIPLQNQTLSWASLPDSSWDGFALLVDDVERYVGPALNYSLTMLADGIPHFFRLAFTSSGTAGDFTKAGTIWPNGTWSDPLGGPS